MFMDYVYIMEVLGNTILTIAIIKMFVYFLKSTDAWIQDGEFPNMVGGIEWKDWTKNLEQVLFIFYLSLIFLYILYCPDNKGINSDC